MGESLAGFTPDQIQFIGGLVITFGVSFVGLIWRVAVWKTKLENDVDNMGYLLGTEKGMALHEEKIKKLQKKKWYRLKK